MIGGTMERTEVSTHEVTIGNRKAVVTERNRGEFHDFASSITQYFCIIRFDFKCNAGRTNTTNSSSSAKAPPAKSIRSSSKPPKKS
jgi:hypothetical protein